MPRRLEAARLRKTWTEGRIHTTAERLVFLAKSRWTPRRPDLPAIEAPYTRAGQPCFYSGRRKVVESHLRVGGVPLAKPIRSTHLEPGVTIVCRTRAQFDAECARRGVVRYDPRTGRTG